jgi:peptide/nickel transport system substrate-binding protein
MNQLPARKPPKRHLPDLRTRRTGRTGLHTFVLVAMLTLALAACSSTSSGHHSPTASAKPRSGGTATFALRAGLIPNYIFPVTSAAHESGTNLDQFQTLMWPPLYAFGNTGSPTLAEQDSLAYPPVFSDRNTTVTLRLKPYRWSDGKPVTSRDVSFFLNLVKANRTSWFAYVPGEFPDDITRIATPKPSVVVLHLTRSFSPTWFTYNQLSQITPLPQHAWDKTSNHSRVGDYDTTASGARAVYNFLAGQADKISTYATNPLWQVVDGPWHLVGYTATGQATFVPNTHYSGPDKPRLSRFIELPFTSDSAEFNALRSGRVTVGYIPQADLRQKGVLNGEGYTFSPWLLYGFPFISINYHNPTAGPLFSQLYIRQALQHLMDQPLVIRKLYDGYATPTYGPVPLKPASKYVSPAERSNPYPYSVGDAKRLLVAHGWHVTPGQPGTCVRPGAGPGECGPGVARGAKLVFHVLYDAGNPPLQGEMEAWKSAAGGAGILLDLSTAPESSVIGTQVACKPSQPSCSWQIANWGRGWTYGPDYLPTGGEFLATGAGSNAGSYSSRALDSLITKTHTSSSLGAFYRYEDYVSRNVPYLFQPQAGFQLTEVKSTLKGVTPQNPFGFIDPADWYFTR